MRILVVTNAFPAPERPAYGIYVARLVAALERDGHDVVLAASSEEGGGWRSLRKYARLALRARSAVRSHRPDVVWGHYLVPTGSIARHAARSAHVPYALTAHGTDVTNAERSPRIRKATLKALGGACVGGGPDGMVSVGPRVAYVGNLIPRKNVARLLAAFATARTEWGSGSLAIAGDGPLRAEIEEIAGALGIADHVRFPGFVAPADVPRWLRACDVACLVSLREGFGLAAIEALACRRPVVVARDLPVAAAVREGVTGALCAAEDVAEMAEALVLAATLQPGETARAAAEPYSLARETARAVAVLEGCL